MPLYHYHCSTCDQRFEVLQKMDEEAPDSVEACPNDGTGCALVKVPTTAGFTFTAGAAGGAGGWDKSSQEGLLIRQTRGAKKKNEDIVRADGSRGSTET